MVASTRAELLRLLRWPVTWVVAGTWLALNLSFAYVVTYFSYRGAVSAGDDRLARILLEDMALADVPSTLVAGMPLFGGALVLILAALATGNGYVWGTWKTVLTQGPGRLAVLSGTGAALGIVVTALVVSTLVLDAAASTVAMAVLDEPLAWPGIEETIRGLGAGVLIMGCWCLIGALLGVLARGPALSVGLGLVWVLVVENLLRGAAQLLTELQVVTDVLPGTAAGSLAAALGAGAQTEPTGTPGVTGILDGGPAAALLAVYALAAAVATVAIVQRRDV